FPDTPDAHRDAVLAHAEEAAGRIPDPEDRCEILLWLLQHVDASARGRIVTRIVDALPQVEPVIKRIRILNDLADFTVPDVLVAALPDEAEWAHNLSFEATQHFAVLIPYLSGTALESLLQVARMVHDKRAQVETLAGLAPYLSAPRRDAAIARAVALEE